MLFSKLEIKGFKSFSDKTVFHFNRGITSIVGPNGCGKSNVVDAIRWVLGEQKTSMLRSEKMENIIFNGSEERPALQMAEVALTIDNTKNLIPTAYTQVTITRRLYRSGESEYLLNNTPCRLKDINNLFLNTGIGSSNYAIIELSMIDNILSERENIRKSLFEEAAGISKFKERKKETLRKINNTDEDLTRIEDLLFEIEKTLKDQEKQVKQTEAYHLIKKNYKEKMISLSKTVLQKEQKEYNIIQKKIDQKDVEKTKLATDMATKEVAVEQNKSDLDESTRQLADQQKKINNQVNIIQRYENEKKIKTERHYFLKNHIEEIEENIEKEKVNCEKIISQIDDSENKKISDKKTIEYLQLKREQAHEDYKTQQEAAVVAVQNVEKMRLLFRRQQDITYTIDKKIGVYKSENASLQEEILRSDSELRQQKETLQNLHREKIAVTESIDKKEEELKQFKVQEEKTQKKITLIKKNIEVKQVRINERVRKLDAQKNEYQLTHSLEENMEGFPTAIKFLKKNKDWSKQPVLLIDVIDTKEKYRKAIESYLEPYLNYCIATDEKEAFQAINILSNHHKGKANFFLLDQLQSYESSPLPDYPNAIPAISIVDYEKKYAPIISYVLDKVYVYDGNIKDISREEKYIFITLTGYITRKWESLAGGSIGLFEGKKIGRAKNLEKLTSSIQKLEEEIRLLKNDIADEKHKWESLQKNITTTSIEVLEREWRLLNEKLASIKAINEQSTRLLTDTVNRKKFVADKIKIIENKIEKINAEWEKAQQQLQIEEKKLITLEEQSKKIREQKDICQEHYNKKNMLVHQQENKIEGVAQELIYKKESLQQIHQHIDNMLQDLEKRKKEISDIIVDISGQDEKIVNLYNQKVSLAQDLSALEQSYYGIKKHQEDFQQQLKADQRRKEDIDSELMALYAKINDHKLNIHSAKERVAVEFGIKIDETFEKDKKDYKIDIQEEELLKQIEKIQEKLKKLGNINPMAVDAYNETKQRYDVIMVQREDLINAKKSLTNVIAETEEEASKKFMDALGQIKKHFSQVFSSLFNKEDTCDIVLTQPNMPLESSLDIIARPKGKKPLHINQLSGGEKTLTAIALLLAIYLLKPAPFCIFDEVDAPLDDANIDKFNGIIRKFSQASQFIIITHNKRTMVNTDIIYGITMAEKGVSKVVPVNLKEIKVK